ncbi:MAG TPA: Txe/YoeB family addiction module toxin [Candidatus Saccharimonadales bacterium]|nr:Txe/YoeB family addiction module toxin [Candidatus Saccharimonadales bacterium]
MAQRNLVFTPGGWDDYLYWSTQDKKTLNKINRLIKDTQREPFAGIGKPEALKGNYAGSWSRRIDDKNRFVYSVTENEILVESCRFHY